MTTRIKRTYNLKEATVSRVRELSAQGLGMVKVSKLAGCGVSVVQRVLAAAQ